jgi:8-oxo-dGTP pyrophosphatase MutT (NUDIX family)
MAEIQLFMIGAKALIRNSDNKILLLHIGEWGENKEHWDFPGGRLDVGESFDIAMRRELKEELAWDYDGPLKFFSSFLTNISIPQDGVRRPLYYVVYCVDWDESAEVQLDDNSAEDKYGWFSPVDAAQKLAYKCTSEFCDMVRNLQ